MSRERIREELEWAAADLAAALLCIAPLPLLLPFLIADWLSGLRS